MLRWLKHLLLVLVARVGLALLWLLLFAGSIVICLIAVLKGASLRASRETDGPLSTYFLNLAVALDVLANVLGGPMWNVLFIRKESRADLHIRFGSRFDTISYVLGMNLAAGTLNSHGRFWCWFLEVVDPGHLAAATGGFEGLQPVL